MKLFSELSLKAPGLTVRAASMRISERVTFIYFSTKPLIWSLFPN